MNEFFRQLANDITRIWSQMSAAQRLLVGGVTAAAVGLLVFLVVWAQQPNFVTLYGKLSDQDAGAIITKIKEKNIPYKMDGTSIMVPESQVHELRLALASNGLPSGGTVGFGELFNGNAGWSQTDFEKKLNYQRGLEGELARTISAIDGVDSVRVHIVIPKESLFIEDEQQTTASVMLTLDPMTKIELEQVKTIQHLVSKAVPKLSADNVFVTDTAGVDYTEAMAKLDPKNLAGTDLSSRQLDMKKKYEREVERKIQGQLDQVLGPENSVVRVNTVWDFSQIETNAEVYTPSAGQTGAMLLSEKFKDETYNGQVNGDGGVPGGNPNTSLAPSSQEVNGGQNGAYTNREGTRNYSPNKEVQRRIKEPAVLKDTTISVAFNPPPRLAGDPAARQRYADKIARMVGLAAGIEDWRNKVFVNDTPFNNSAAVADANASRDASNRAWWLRMATVLGSVIVGLIALGLVMMSFRRRRRDELQELEEALPRLPADDLGITLIDDEHELSGSSLGELSAPSPDEQRLLEMQRELAAYIKGQPKDAVKLVRAWMDDDE